MRPWNKGDIVQIDPEHDTVFGGCLMVVSEPKAWGAQGYVNVPGQGLAYYRVKEKDAKMVGKAEWLFEMKQEDEDDED